MVNYARLAVTAAAMTVLIGPTRNYDHGFLSIKEPRDKDWLKRKAKRANAKKARRRSKSK